MAISFRSYAESIATKFMEMRFFQQAKELFEQLDPVQRRFFVKAVALGVFLVVFFSLCFFWYRVSQNKKQLSQKMSLLYEFKKAQTLYSDQSGELFPLKSFDLIKKEIILVSKELGFSLSASDFTEMENIDTDSSLLEYQTDISVKDLNLKVALQWIKKLESMKTPIRVKHLVIKTKPNLSGYLDLTLQIAIFGVDA
jgi:hypothetical protein